jgi:hypothetical protein
MPMGGVSKRERCVAVMANVTCWAGRGRSSNRGPP